MGEPARNITELPKRQEKSSHGESVDATLKTRGSQELIIGFAGPVGCGIALTIEQTKKALEAVNYEVFVIKLSAFIRKSLDTKVIEIDTSNYSELGARAQRLLTLQDGGNELRKRGVGILAEYAIKEVVMHRGIQAEAEGHTGNLHDYTPKRVAYLIDQIKHPGEVTLLRTVYGKLFHLIGVISVSPKRSERLISSDRIDSRDISMVMERDRRQEESNGQQLDKALQMADFFVSSDQGTTSSLQKKLKRFLDLLHNENVVTPTAQEYGMYVAYAAGLKSACLSRQVGAAIADASGKVVSTGCNDVPKALGGLYTTEDGDHDRRCVHREEQVCFNDREKNLLKSDIEEALEKATGANQGMGGLSAAQLASIVDSVYRASHIKDLIEFSRAVHAEMDAIIALARAGTPGIQGSTLYTTTFPCHSCARHIVAAGIEKVYYIEPYEKSLAQRLHSDAIAFDTEDDDAERRTPSGRQLPTLVRFIHFEGVAPRQYLNFFKMNSRKDEKTGKVIRIASISAQKTIGEYLDDYRTFETKVVQHLRDTMPEVTEEG